MTISFTAYYDNLKGQAVGFCKNPFLLKSHIPIWLLISCFSLVGYGAKDAQKFFQAEPGDQTHGLSRLWAHTLPKGSGSKTGDFSHPPEIKMW